MIKKLKNKVLPIAFSVLLYQPAFASWQPAKGEISYTIADNKGTYSSQLYRDSENPFRKSWHIYQGNNLIGDEVNENDSYQDLAFTSAIARQVSRSPTLIDQLEHYQQNFDKLLRNYNSTRTIPRSVITYGSQLGGALLTSIPGSVSASATSQVKTIESLARKAALRFIDESIERIYVKDPNLSEIELSNQTRKKAEDKSLQEIELAYKRLEKAKDILRNHKGPWTPREASEFYSNYRSLIYGLSYADLLRDIHPENSRTITKRFGIEASKGIGVPERILVKDPDVKRFLADPNLADKIRNLETYISQRSKIFDPIEEFYTGIERPTSATQSTIQDIDKKSNRSDIISLGWSFSKDSGDTTMHQNETACLNIAVLNQNLEGEKFKNLDIIIDDILDPQLRKVSQQPINFRVRYGDETVTSPVIYEPNMPKRLNNAVCATSSYEKGHFAIKYHFTYKDENNTQHKTNQFTNTIKVE